MNDQQTDVELERPDSHEELGDELYCWMPGNADRQCEGSCVAYDGSYMEDQRRSPCMLLNAARSIAMSFGIQANLTKKAVKSQDIHARQELASKLPDPPEVR